MQTPQALLEVEPDLPRTKRNELPRGVAEMKRMAEQVAKIEAAQLGGQDMHQRLEGHVHTELQKVQMEMVSI